jgi:hypothetical protein
MSTSWTVYQPLMVGLGAVTIATIGNTFLEWWKQQLSDDRTGRLVRKALIQELRAAKRTAEGGIESCNLELGSDEGFMIPIAEHYPIYEQFLKDLGCLEDREIGPVVDAYAHLKAIPEWLVFTGRFIRVESWLHVHVERAHVTTVGGINAKVLRKVDDALSALESPVRARWRLRRG